VICLKHPSDYMAEQGARFEVVFEKARGLLGKEVETIEAALQDANGKARMKPAEIAGELGVHRSTVYRALKGYEEGGS
jgi:predicted transcriptional regulator